MFKLVLLLSLVASFVSVRADTIRGANVGGWLVLEKWMTPSLFYQFGDNDVPDEWTFTKTLGQTEAKSQLESHWNSWFTESDVQTLQSLGINSLRIPIGFWAFKTYDNQPYVHGAADHLDQALGWCKKHGMTAWVDLHGAPGSQNGFDNSGHQGSVEWQTADNLGRTYEVLKIMAERYGTSEYRDVVVGFELVNEPISWGNNDLGVTKQFYRNAEALVRSVFTNSNLQVVLHDSFVGPNEFTSYANGDLVGIDTHIYQCFVDEDNALNQKQHIQKACGQTSSLSSANSQLPVYVGEFSAHTNVCVDADGSVYPGTSCSNEGCSCANDDSRTWSDNMIQLIRQYVEAQLDAWEASTSGYYFWSFKTEISPTWNLIQGAQNGWIPSPITDRKYPGQCNGQTYDLGSSGSSQNTPTTTHHQAAQTTEAPAAAEPSYTKTVILTFPTAEATGAPARRIKRGSLGR